MDVWFLTQVVVMLVSTVATLVGASSGVVFEFFVSKIVYVMGSMSPYMVTLP